jgi:hypothetical protein
MKLNPLLVLVSALQQSRSVSSPGRFCGTNIPTESHLSTSAAEHYCTSDGQPPEADGFSASADHAISVKATQTFSKLKGHEYIHVI